MALFPSGAESGRRSPLFPSTTAPHQAPESHSTARDWLKNESYQPQPSEVKGEILSGANSEGIRHSSPPSSRSSHSASGKRHKDKHKHHRSKHHKHQRKSSPLISSSSSSSSVPLKPNTIWIEDSGLDPKDAYRMDKTPDRSNLHYDTLYSGNVASYRRAFGSHTLGLEPGQWEEFGIGHEKKQKRDKSVRYFSKVLAPSELLLMHKERVPRRVNDEEYLSLSKLGEKEEGREAEEEEEGEKEGGGAHGELTVEHYLSQCTAEYNRKLLSEPKNVSLWLEFIAFQDHSLLWGRTAGVCTGQEAGSGATSKTRIATIERKLSILERALESNPLSVELLGAQMTLAREVWEPGKILRRWKDLVFQQPNQPLLWLDYIRFCRSQFSTFSTPSLSSLYTKSLSTLSSIQEGSLRSHQPGPLTPSFMLAIFVLYCHYLQQAGHSERAVASFQALLEFNLCCPPEVDAAEITMKERLDFFETFCDSGVPRIGEEGATGWRGWMSATQQGKVAARLAMVDVPSHYKAMNRPETVKEEEEEEEEVMDPEVVMVAGRPLPEAWVMLERRREREESLPLRGEGEEECTDPDRMVLFDDIRPALFRLTDPSLQLQAVLSFVRFLGVPIPISTPLTLSPPHTSLPLTLTPHHTSSSITSLHEVSPLFLPFSSPTHPQHSFQPLGAGSRLHPLLASLSDWATGGHTHIITGTNHPHNVASFVANVFSQTLGLFSDPKSQTLVAEAWLSYEIAALSAEGIFSSQKLSKEQRQRVKEVQKLVKAMLKLELHRNNLCLWNCCALIELYLSGVRDSVKIYQAILSQHQPRRGGENDSDVILLYRCFSEVTLGLRTPLLLPPLPSPSFSPSHSLTLHTLVSLTEGTYRLPASDKPSPSPAHILKARHTFQLQSPERQTDTHWVVCHAYFEYLTRGIKTTCSVLNSHVTILVDQLKGTEKQSREQELVLQALEDTYQVQVCLLRHHSLSHPLSPSLLRDSLEQALSHFPDHGGFLASFIDNEQQSFISGRLRRYFDTHTSSSSSSSSSPIPWIYAIKAELQRYSRLTVMASVVKEGGGEGGGGGGGGGGESSSEPASGVLYRVRGLLHRATQSSCAQTCPLLWRLYMKFEIEQQNFTQARALFFQAIHHCPWAKVLYVDAAEYFPSELSHIAELMEEKELRMRAPLEEVKLLLSAGGSAMKKAEEQLEDMDCL